MTHTTEILWDTWGIPHIFAPDDDHLAYAYGWAQMHSHGNLILQLYAQARGRAAEYFGESLLLSDIFVRTRRIPKLAEQWYAAQSPRFRRMLDSFAQGVNAYAASHTSEIDASVHAVLPICGTDLLAHTMRVIHYTFVSDAGHLTAQWLESGSNAWTLGPSYTASGNAMLLGNPHLPWSDIYMFYESHLTTPACSFYGTTLVGFAAPMFGFNEHLGWTLTVNTYDGSDAYVLTLCDDGNGYLFDGEVRAFDTSHETILIRNDDGTYAEELLTVRHSIHGPVIVEKDTTALALRVAGLDRPGFLEQSWDMARATNLSEFEAIVQRMHMPMSNIVYADHNGVIMLLFNGLVPVRSRGDWTFWRGYIPGDTSDLLWTTYHPFDDLPYLINPTSGWLSNSNEPPWYMTLPYPFKPADFPPYLSPSVPDVWNFRWQYSVRLLRERQCMTFDDMVACKFSSRSELADRILDQLIAIARSSSSDLAKQAINVLQSWDRTYNADSRGALLFWLWSVRYRQNAHTPFAVAWNNDAPPLSVPNYLEEPITAILSLGQAAMQIQKMGKPLDIAWGDAVRMQVGDYDLPASGGNHLETFRVLEGNAQPDGTYQVCYGDTFIFAVEFASPLRAEALLTYGNASQPNSPHRGDQLDLYTRNQLRTVWLSRSEIEDNLEFAETLDVVL